MQRRDKDEAAKINTNSNAGAGGNQPLGNQQLGNQPPGNQPFSNQPPGNQPPGNQPPNTLPSSHSALDPAMLAAALTNLAANQTPNNTSGNSSWLPQPVPPPTTANSALQQEALDAIRTSMSTLAEVLKNKQQIIPVYITQPQSPSITAVQDQKIIVEQTIETIEGRNLKSSIRSYFNKIREKLDTKEPVKVPYNTEKKDQVIGLLDHLVKLQEDIPPESLPNINLADMTVRIEYLREKLSGKKGLKRKIEQMYQKAVQDYNSADTATGNSVNQLSGTLQFIRKMVNFLPDEAIRKALDHKIDKVIRKMPQ